ncbi:MAG: 3-phosphoshikimate 1-carboxyvinyltransferase, partial [Candidatus Heimdallarchaeota archaeon]|nr:3-phosphoshikimate 1-carboxyvinyltransferase [Candidatus Heimdallarchaeota archaeon]
MVSKPYFDLTIQMLRKHGIEVEQDDNEYVFHGNSSITNTKVPVPMDFSSAAFFFAAGALPGNKIQVKGNFSDLIQADRKLLDFLSEMGAKVRTYDDVIIVEGTELYGIDADLQSCPDLFPIMCVLATQAVGVTKLFGAPHLRYKESNRIEAMTQILKSLGGRIIPQDDGAIIENSLISGGKTLKTQGDHRIAMASAILGTLAEKPISIVDTQSISISYPTFLSDLTSLSEENWNN